MLVRYTPTGVPWDPGYETWYKMTTDGEKSHDPIVIGFESIPSCDRRTDGLTTDRPRFHLSLRRTLAWLSTTKM